MRHSKGKHIPIVLNLPYETCEMLVFYLRHQQFETIQEAFFAFAQHAIKETPPENFALNHVMREYIAATLRVIGQETNRFTGELYARVEREIESKINDIETKGP